MKQTIVINVAGLTRRFIGKNTPNIKKLVKQGFLSSIENVFPSLTCSVQATYLTGLLPNEHGIVGNGWYDRDISEIHFWKQSNQLISGEKIWHTGKGKDKEFTCAQLFWWFNMNSDADISVTPRPIYRADGLKIPDIYTKPNNIKNSLITKLGKFPLYNFWGPDSNIYSSKWISACSKEITESYKPTLSLVYLPHLDYCLQKLGPSHPDIPLYLKEIDDLCGDLIDNAQNTGSEVIILSEYGITEVSKPIHINRILREAGFIQVRNELGSEILDMGASQAFAVSDHQIAHIYIKNKKDINAVKRVLMKNSNIEEIINPKNNTSFNINHDRSGDLIAISKENAWFTYYYWLSDSRAPDFARTVDIHRKPGYDPVELFMNPKLRFPKLSIAKRIIKKKMGFRTLMDVIPIDADLVKGSHGRMPTSSSDMPIFISSNGNLSSIKGIIHATDVKELILSHIFDT
jgi:predicted AlkP superfamily pyrophosphatase or phosphodiesterase